MVTPKHRCLPQKQAQRTLEKKRVTLIEAWRTPQGIVIHADSQETWGDYRITVNKVKPIAMGNFDVIVAGAGNPGDLVDSFTPCLARHISNPVDSIGKFSAAIEHALIGFYDRDVKRCTDPNKTVRFLVAAFHKPSRTYEAWVTNNLIPSPIPHDEPFLIGWDEPLYRHAAKRLYSPNMKIPQAVLAGLYVLTIGEATANCIRNPFSVAVVANDGIKMEPEEYIRRLTDRLAEYEKHLNSLFLSCADTTISVPEMEDMLSELSKSLTALHKSHIDHEAEKMTIGELIHGYPQRRLPAGPIKVSIDQKLTVEHDRQKIAETKQRWDKIKILANAGPIAIMVNCKCGSDYEVVFDNYFATSNKTAKCSKCEKENSLAEIDLKDVRLVSAS